MLSIFRRFHRAPQEFQDHPLFVAIQRLDAFLLSELGWDARDLTLDFADLQKTTDRLRALRSIEDQLRVLLRVRHLGDGLPRRLRRDARKRLTAAADHLHDLFEQIAPVALLQVLEGGTMALAIRRSLAEEVCDRLAEIRATLAYLNPATEPEAFVQAVESRGGATASAHRMSTDRRSLTINLSYRRPHARELAAALATARA